MVRAESCCSVCNRAEITFAGHDFLICEGFCLVLKFSGNIFYVGTPVSLEVARGIGLTRAQQLTRVELPMAVPYVMSGIRIAAVSAVSTMTIAAFAGANGLGWFIVLGMNSRNYPLTLMGAVAASVMALALDFLLGRVEKAVTSEGLLPPDQIKNLSRTVRRRRRNVAWGLCVALIGVSVLSYAALI